MNTCYARTLLALYGACALFSTSWATEPVSSVSLAASSAPQGDAARGAVLYQARCTACHSVDYNGTGPAHRGVFSRNAGQAPGFGGYSPALKRSGVVWTAQSLDRWLANPEQFIPGQRMGVSVPDAGERADLIAYLKSLGASH